MVVSRCPNCDYDTRGLPSNVCPECGQTLPDSEPSQVPSRLARIALAVMLVGTTLIVAWWAAIIPGYPRWWGPLPLTVIIPYFMTENAVLAVVPITVAGILLSIPVMRGHRSIVLPATISIGVLIVVSWLYFINGISYGLRYQSGAYVAVCGVMQGAFTTSLIVLGFSIRQRRKYAVVVLWYLLAAMWLASYAFPYLGELP